MESFEFSKNDYQDLLKRLDEINQKLNDKGIGMSERWIDNMELMQLLKISRRTCQNYRDSNELAYSIIGNKIFYRMSDVEGMLNRHYNKRLS